MRLSEWVALTAKKQHISTSDAFSWELCLTEVVTNVMSYGFDNGAHAPIQVNVINDERGLAMEIIDTGKAFNPLEGNYTPTAKTLEEAKVGGLGIHIVRSYMDVLEYKRENDQNILRMILKSEG